MRRNRGTAQGFHPKSLDYRERCVALAQIPPPAAVRQVIPDIEVWAKNIKNARNHLAHGDEPHKRKMSETVWYNLYEPGVALLVLVAMTKLGVPERTQLKSLRQGALKRAVLGARASRPGP